MAQLDAMLRALAERGARELYLTDGSRPLFRFPEGDRPVSQVVLKRAQIVRLMSELGPHDQVERLRNGESARFVYDLAGSAFDCAVDASSSTLSVRVAPSVAAPEAIDAPELSAPAPAPTPSAGAASREGAPAIERLLLRLVDSGGSDLHIAPDETPMLRLHGDMVRIEGETQASPEHTAGLLYEIMPSRNKKEFEETSDTDFAYEIPGIARFRVNVFTDRKGVGAVFRVIPSDILSASTLGLPDAILELCRLSKGLVLVTGPTGSGKSTTLAAMIDYINDTRSDHIITIEDPIEFVHPNKRCLVNQREVVTHTQSFKKALRAALREDPDIVLVGELRDLETIEIAIETAETGHLVFGTLHTTTACSTVDRIIDQFPTDRQSQIRTMLSESLKGVIAQTLLKKTGGGRVAALEVLIGIPAISNLIREGKTFQIPSIMQTGKKHGMVLLNDALMGLVKSKTVAPEDAYAKAVDRAGLAAAMRVAGIELTRAPDA